MTLHYYVIWCRNGDMTTRKEDSMDFDIDHRDESQIQSDQRIDAIKDEINERYTIPKQEISLLNICRL